MKKKPKQTRLPIDEVFPHRLVVTEYDGIDFRAVAEFDLARLDPDGAAAIYERVQAGRLESPAGTVFVEDA